MHFELREPALGKGAECEEVLRSLPDWFGIESAIAAYADRIQVLPTISAYANQEMIGFLTLEHHSPESAEIHVMGVRAEYHRSGIGRALLRAAENSLAEANVKFLQVKTLSPARVNEAYARTRKFYRAMGFSPLEEMPELWGRDNPCLIMVKALPDSWAMRRYHHMGIPTAEPRNGEVFLPEFGMYVLPFDSNAYGIEWIRFTEDSKLPELVKRVPHIAFETDDLLREISGREILIEPNSPSPGVTVAFIVENGAPVEFLQYDKREEQNED